MFEEKNDTVNKEFAGEVGVSKGVGCVGETPCQDGFFSFTYMQDTDSYSVSCIKAGAGGVPETVVIPAEYNGKSVTRIEDKGFRSCNGLRNVLISKTVTSIGEGAFIGCLKLTSVSIPSSVKWIGPSAFEGCTGLLSISIPDGVPFIGGWSFAGCSNLTDISMPPSITRIGEYSVQVLRDT